MQNDIMTVQLSIRNVPEQVRDELAARAARSGRSLQEYLLAELERLASRPSAEVWLERVRTRKATAGSRVPVRRILAERAADRR
jgi:plasmid stability protein